MSAAPTTSTPAPVAKPKTINKIAITVTWQEIEDKMDSDVDPNRAHARKLMGIAKTFGDISGFVIIGKKKAEF